MLLIVSTQVDMHTLLFWWRFVTDVLKEFATCNENMDSGEQDTVPIACMSITTNNDICLQTKAPNSCKQNIAIE